MTLKDPYGNESVESSEFEVRTGGVARDLEETEETVECLEESELEEARLLSRL